MPISLLGAGSTGEGLGRWDDLEIEMEDPSTRESCDALTRALRAYNAEVWGEPGYRDVGFFVRDRDRQLLAGLTSKYRWGWLCVEKLWVAESRRGRGLGTHLLGSAEAFARDQGGVALHLTAADPAAVRFYVARGFEIVGQMAGFPPGGNQVFLRKELGASPGSIL